MSREAMNREDISREAMSCEIMSPQAMSREAMSRDAMSREAMSSEAMSLKGGDSGFSKCPYDLNRGRKLIIFGIRVTSDHIQTILQRLTAVRQNHL